MFGSVFGRTNNRTNGEPGRTRRNNIATDKLRLFCQSLLSVSFCNRMQSGCFGASAPSATRIPRKTRRFMASVKNPLFNFQNKIRYGVALLHATMQHRLTKPNVFCQPRTERAAEQIDTKKILTPTNAHLCPPMPTFVHQCPPLPTKKSLRIREPLKIKGAIDGTPNHIAP